MLILNHFTEHYVVRVFNYLISISCIMSAKCFKKVIYRDVINLKAPMKMMVYFDLLTVYGE